MSATPSLIILTGCPPKWDLQWDEGSLLSGIIAPFNEPGVSFPRHTASEALASQIPPPKFRSLPLTREYLHTGLTPLSAHPYYEGGNLHGPAKSNLLNASSRWPGASVSSNGINEEALPQVFTGDDDEAKSQFLETSFALLEELPSSPPAASERFSSSDDTTISSLLSIDGSTAPPPPRHPPPHLVYPIPKPASLNSLPSASYLESIRDRPGPPPMVDLLVAIIDAPVPGIVIAKKDGRQLPLLELTVGDETSAGFEVKLWLAAPNDEARNSHPAPPGPTLTQAARSLRPRDIVLFRKVRICEYKGKVYAQNLRGENTKALLLHRSPVDEDDDGDIGCYALGELDGIESAVDRRGIELLRKAARVRDWTVHRLGVGLRPASEGAGVGGDRKQRGWEKRRAREGKRTAGDETDAVRKRARMLPPDTQ